jgi:hypothetical protein
MDFESARVCRSSATTARGSNRRSNLGQRAWVGLRAERLEPTNKRQNSRLPGAPAFKTDLNLRVPILAKQGWGFRFGYWISYQYWLGRKEEKAGRLDPAFDFKNRLRRLDLNQRPSGYESVAAKHIRDGRGV